MKHTSGRSNVKNQNHDRKNSAPLDVSDEMMTDIDTEMKADEMPGSSETAAASAAPSAADTEAKQDTQSRSAQTSSNNSSKSISALIGDSLAKESQATIDESLAKLNNTYKEAKKYASESPAEAVLLACSVGMAAWALLGTKPGRKVFDVAAARFVPEITSWASKTFKASLA